MSVATQYSSISNSLLRGKKYDVFLSFRGEDMRKTLVDHLFQSLSAAGVHVFLDSERLARGGDLQFSFEQAINDTYVHIPIFSKNYAKSAWCLREISQMCGSDGLIIPLFYDVEPSDVRHAKGVFAEAFEYHGCWYSHDKIAEWKQDLETVACRSGWELKSTGGVNAFYVIMRLLVNLLV
eukprot:Gb_06499 [translate_table: standard]